MKVLIVDNERHIIEGLTALIELYCPGIKEIKTSMTWQEAKELVDIYSPDLVFLDVELDEGTGMDLLRAFPSYGFQVIFITAYDQYAIDAIKHQAIDYLLKPIDPDDLKKAVERAAKKLELQEDQVKLNLLVSSLGHLKNKEETIIVTDRESIYALEINQIVYLEADGPYTRIVKEDETLYVSKNLKKFEVLLQNSGFYRLHHSYLANLNHMKRFDKSNSQLEFKNGMKVAVSIRKRDGLIDRIRSKA